MKILTRYIVKEFLKIFTLTLAAFVSLYLIIDIFEQLGRLMTHHVQFGEGLAYFLCKIPFIFYQVTPVAVLVATLISLGIFVKHNEITAAMAGGIGALRFSLPLFIIAFAISMLNFILNESVIPLSNQKVITLEQTLEGTDRKTTFAQESIWFRDNMDIYSINYIEPQKGVLKGLTMYKLDNNFNVIQRLDTKEVNWINGAWIAAESRLMSFQEDKMLSASKEVGNIIPLDRKSVV